MAAMRGLDIGLAGRVEGDAVGIGADVAGSGGSLVERDFERIGDRGGGLVDFGDAADGGEGVA